jgi:hypothetical protein
MGIAFTEAEAIERATKSACLADEEARRLAPNVSLIEAHHDGARVWLRIADAVVEADRRAKLLAGHTLANGA